MCIYIYIYIYIYINAHAGFYDILQCVIICYTIRNVMLEIAPNNNASLCCLKELVVLQKGDNDEPTVSNGFQNQYDEGFLRMCVFTTFEQHPCIIHART